MVNSKKCYQLVKNAEKNTGKSHGMHLPQQKVHNIKLECTYSKSKNMFQMRLPIIDHLLDKVYLHLKYGGY